MSMSNPVGETAVHEYVVHHNILSLLLCTQYLCRGTSGPKNNDVRSKSGCIIYFESDFINGNITTCVMLNQSTHRASPGSVLPVTFWPFRLQGRETLSIFKLFVLQAVAICFNHRRLPIRLDLAEVQCIGRSKDRQVGYRNTEKAE